MSDLKLSLAIREGQEYQAEKVLLIMLLFLSDQRSLSCSLWSTEGVALSAWSYTERLTQITVRMQPHNAISATSAVHLTQGPTPSL